MVNKKNKNVFARLNIILFITGMLTSCSIFTVPQKSPEYVIDFVCGMKADKAEAYTWKYKGTKYYFDTYSCKESFKMNPEKFIQNKCTDTSRVLVH